jgi:hypothetical protein
MKEKQLIDTPLQQYKKAKKNQLGEDSYILGSRKTQEVNNVLRCTWF